MTAWSSRLGERHRRANDLYLDLVDTLAPDDLRARLPNARSSPVSNHFWCVVGARESYVRAARAGSWQGFGCSLRDDEDTAAVRSALERSATEVRAWLDELGDEDDAGWETALALLEHEAQYHH